MKKYKIISKEGLLGIQDSESKEFIIPCNNQSAKILCNNYFYLCKKGKKMVVDENNKLIFDLNNRPNYNQFSTSLGVFQMLCIEEQGDKCSFYGENIDDSAPEEQQIHQVIIKDNKLSRKLMTKREYLDYMIKETGFNIIKDRLTYLSFDGNAMLGAELISRQSPITIEKARAQVLRVKNREFFILKFSDDGSLEDANKNAVKFLKNISGEEYKQLFSEFVYSQKKKRI